MYKIGDIQLNLDNFISGTIVAPYFFFFLPGINSFTGIFIPLINGTNFRGYCLCKWDSLYIYTSKWHIYFKKKGADGVCYLLTNP